MTDHRTTGSIIFVLMTFLLCALATSSSAATGDGLISHQFIPDPDYAQDDAKALLRIASADVYALPRTDVDWKDPQGNTIHCRPVGGGCIIRNEYSANGSLIASTHEFYIAGQGRVAGTYTAIAKYCYPDPYTHVCYGWTELFQETFTITESRENWIYLPHVIR